MEKVIGYIRRLDDIWNKIQILTEDKIKNMVYEICGQRVMLDFELAKIYGYTTKRFNEQVKRNIEKFDSDFMFQLTDEEINEISRSQNATLNRGTGRGSNIKYNPYAFKEQGIYMLMTVLKGELAIKQSKTLIRMFKRMKEYILENSFLINHRELARLSLNIEKVK